MAELFIFLLLTAAFVIAWCIFVPGSEAVPLRAGQVWALKNSNITYLVTFASPYQISFTKFDGTYKLPGGTVSRAAFRELLRREKARLIS